MRRQNKYGAKATILEGRRFASRREARRDQDLKLLEAAGEIHSLRLQVPYSLRVGSIEIGKYVADFVYFERALDREIIEDCKGYRTAMYKWKKRHFEAEYKTELRET